MAKTTMTLSDLVTQLHAVHGPGLQAVVLYGSAASDEAVAGYSDQNVLVIVHTLDLATLRQLGQTARAWQEAGNPPPLTLTLDEWTRSADIFPMEYADILERHRVLDGTLPLEGIYIDAAHLRLQVEQEAMGKLLRLRRGVMTAGTDAKRQLELLRASYSALLVIFRAVVRLHGERPPRDAHAVIQAVASHAGFDPGAFERVSELVRGSTIAERDAEATLTGYVHGMDALVMHLDRYAPPPAV
jgi:predicted nucleotidyltransferase